MRKVPPWRPIYGNRQVKEKSDITWQRCPPFCYWPRNIRQHQPATPRHRYVLVTPWSGHANTDVYNLLLHAECISLPQSLPHAPAFPLFALVAVDYSSNPWHHCRHKSDQWRWCTLPATYWCVWCYWSSDSKRRDLNVVLASGSWKNSFTPVFCHELLCTGSECKRIPPGQNILYSIFMHQLNSCMHNSSVVYLILLVMPTASVAYSKLLNLMWYQSTFR